MIRSFLLSLIAIFATPPALPPSIVPSVPVPTVTLEAPSESLPASLSAGTVSLLSWDKDTPTPATAPASLYQTDELSGSFTLTLSDAATASGQGDVSLTSLLPTSLFLTQKSGNFIYQTTGILSVKFATTLVELATGSAQINQLTRYPTIKLTAGTAKFAQVGSDDLPHLYFLKGRQTAYFTPWGIYIY